jgi:ribosomal protein L11 methyltransferase
LSEVLFGTASLANEKQESYFLQVFMQWLEIKFNINKIYLELFSDMLLELGAVAITESSSNNETVFQLVPNEEPKWDDITLTVLFPKETDLHAVSAQILIIFTNINQPFSTQSIIVNKIADLDWQDNYKQYLKPMQFGKKLWICPSWHSIPDPSSVNVILDPGQAFGTGTHETTSLCLNWLEENIRPGMSIVDYGCGSGILAIAAIKLGASKAYAVDIDPKAVEVTKENSAINSAEIYACLPEDPLLENLQLDLVIANILVNPLTTLVETLSKFLKPNGIIVLSGILDSQVELVTSCYAKYFTNFVVQHDGEWVRITGAKSI